MKRVLRELGWWVMAAGYFAWELARAVTGLACEAADRRVPAWRKAAVVVLVAGLVALVAWADFDVWRLQHPTAPAWTWLWSNG